jgi:class 3 adenylate cyclase
MRKPPPHVPRHRSIMAVDVEASTTRRNPDKIVLRTVLYQLFEAALHSGGITRRRRDPLINCGDGILTLIRPADDMPKTLLLNQVIPTLDRLLAEHNTHRPGHRLRLRAAVHAGEVHYDRHGCFGEALDLTFRLLNSPELKATLCRSSAPLALVVSDIIYQSIIRQGYDRINQHTFQPLAHVKIADQNHHGWVHLPTAETPAFVPLPRTPPMTRQYSSLSHRQNQL